MPVPFNISILISDLSTSSDEPVGDASGVGVGLGAEKKLVGEGEGTA